MRAVRNRPRVAPPSTSTCDRMQSNNRTCRHKAADPAAAPAVGVGRADDRGLGGVGVLLGGCFGETYQRGYVLPEGALEQIPIGVEPGAGADRARHALHRRHRQRRGVLLHLAARRAAGRLHAAESGRPAGDRGLFRQEPPGRAARQLRPEGRQGVRLRQPHHADRRPGTELPHRDVQDQPSENCCFASARDAKAPRTNAAEPFDDDDYTLNAPAPRAAAAPRCW